MQDTNTFKNIEDEKQTDAQANVPRHITSPVEFFKLFFPVIKSLRVMKTTEFQNNISPEFSERISLSVSGVNKCEYCSWLHSKTSLEKGMSNEEIKCLLDGELAHAPEEETRALLYAQHWADKKGHVSKDARDKVLDYYGKIKLHYIENSIQAVYFGNLCSNTAYAIRTGMIKKPAWKLRISYMLSVPIANKIRNGASD